MQQTNMAVRHVIRIPFSQVEIGKVFYIPRTGYWYMRVPCTLIRNLIDAPFPRYLSTNAINLQTASELVCVSQNELVELCDITVTGGSHGEYKN